MTTQFPIVRQGRMVRTTNQAGQHRALTFLQSEKAVDLLQERSEAFLDALKQGLAKAAADQKTKFRWLDETHQHVGKLSPARRSQTLGAIYDFAELAFKLGEAVVIFRACVTVCVKGDNPDARTPFSKFWTRYLLVSHGEARSGLATDLSPTTLVAFDDVCSKLTTAAMEAMAPLYTEVITKVLGEPVQVDFETQGELSVLALDTAGEDFAATFAALQAGVSLGGLLGKKAATARCLVELAAQALAGKAYKPKTTVVEELFPDADYQLVAYESTDADRGLFLARIDNACARFVGLTRAPDAAEAPQETGGFRQAHAASSSVVSGGLVTQYGMQF